MKELDTSLANSRLFSAMTPLELAAVESFLEMRRLAPGEILFREGEVGSELYIVHSGIMGSWVAQADGTRRDLYEFHAGDQFGEMAVIETAPRTATCYAREPTELYVLAAIDFYRLVWEHPIIGVKLLTSLVGVMARWLDEASGFLGDMVRWGEAARKRSITDDLSGLFNRRFLDDALRLRFSRGSPETRQSSLLMLDIDRFREINAAFGPSAGDAVIANVSAAFGRLVADPGLAARLSGDEFAVFLPAAPLEEAAALAERLRAAAEALYLEFRSGPGAEPRRLAITVSIGVAQGCERADSLVAAADKALFAAKEAGRNRVMVDRDGVMEAPGRQAGPGCG
jgi:diguanylate cyclase (GGDEF)-like protein